MDRPVLDLTWDYPTWGPQDEPDADQVLAEINGRDADGKPLSRPTPSSSPTAPRPAAAGSTAGSAPTG